MSFETFTIEGTTPASASTAIGTTIAGLERFDFFMIDADLVGATGGALDVYLQREIAPNVWRDWLHFPQLASGAAAVSYTVPTNGEADIYTVGTGTDSTASPALAADSFVGGHPGNRLRAVYVAGASTSAGADITIRINCWIRQS